MKMYTTTQLMILFFSMLFMHYKERMEQIKALQVTNQEAPSLLINNITDNCEVLLDSTGRATYKIIYSDKEFFRNFQLSDCKKYLANPSQYGLSRDDIDELEDLHVIALYGEQLLEKSREKSLRIYCKNHELTMCNLDSYQRFGKDDSVMAVADRITDLDAPTPEDVYMMLELKETLCDEISKLTIKQQEVLLLKLEELSDAEVSRKLGIDHKSVSNRKIGAFARLMNSKRLNDLR